MTADPGSTDSGPTVRARHPRLVRLDDPIVLIGHRCRACDRRAFPPDPYGCERCGAPSAELEAIDLRATGVVQALATVHRHHHDDPPTPFTVATIVLDDGVTLKSVIDGPGPVDIGRRVQAVPVSGGVDDDGAEVVDLRFRPV